MRKDELEKGIGSFVDFSYGLTGVYVGLLMTAETSHSRLKVVSIKKYPSIDVKDILPLVEGLVLCIDNRNIFTPTCEVLPYRKALAEVFNAKFNQVHGKMNYYKANPQIHRVQERLIKQQVQLAILQRHKMLINPYCN